jgi:hypothetical protein
VHYSFIIEKFHQHDLYVWFCLSGLLGVRGRTCMPFGWLHLCLRVVRKHPTLIPSHHFTQEAWSCLDCSNKSPATVFLHTIRSSESNRGTNFAPTRRMPKSFFQNSMHWANRQPYFRSDLNNGHSPVTRPYLDTSELFRELFERFSYKQCNGPPHQLK